MPSRWLIFSDLDGTLLDAHTYNLEPAVHALERLRERGIPLILCSSKTRFEMDLWWKRLGLRAPFIVENGSAVVFPSDWRPLPQTDLRPLDGFLVWELGLSHERVFGALTGLARETGMRIKELSTMDPEEIVELTGLGRNEALLARRREYSEAFTVLSAPAGAMDRFLERAREIGLEYAQGGRFHHLMGPTSKGRAIELLSALIRRKTTATKTVGLGDSPNDFAMLEAVDVPILVQRPDGTYAQPPSGVRFYLAPGIGPHGWAAAIQTLIEQGGLPAEWLGCGLTDGGSHSLPE